MLQSIEACQRGSCHIIFCYASLLHTQQHDANETVAAHDDGCNPNAKHWAFGLTHYGDDVPFNILQGFPRGLELFGCRGLLFRPSAVQRSWLYHCWIQGNGLQVCKQELASVNINQGHFAQAQQPETPCHAAILWGLCLQPSC